MNGFLRQSTASQVRAVGPFVDDTDFKTLETALSIANTDVKLKKNGAAAANKNSGGATADSTTGMYHLTFDATDSNTVGELFFSIKVAGALVVFGSYTVLEEVIYDALFAASAPGWANATDQTAIKTKTDQFVFTVANQVNANALTVGDKSGYSLTADIRIKKNTALSNFTFLMLDTSGNADSGLTVAAQRSLDGGTLTTMANSVVEISNGLYKINLAAADTNADWCCYRFTASGAQDRIVSFPTQTE